MGKMALLKGNSKRKILWAVSFIAIFMFYLAPAAAFEFDNVPKFIENDRYGVYEVKNFFGIGDSLIKLDLANNTAQCNGNNCDAIINIELYDEGKIIDNIRFIDLGENLGQLTSIPGIEYYKKIGEEKVSRDIVDYICTDETIKNGTEPDRIQTTCVQNITQEYYTIPVWDKIDIAQDYVAGNYTIRIAGQLNARQVVDWQILTKGIWLSQWAVWNATASVYNVGASGATDPTGSTLDFGLIIRVGPQDINLTKIGIRNTPRATQFKVKYYNGTIIRNMTTKTDGNGNFTCGNCTLSANTTYRLETTATAGTQSVISAYQGTTPKNIGGGHMVIENLSLGGANTTNPVLYEPLSYTYYNDIGAATANINVNPQLPVNNTFTTSVIPTFVCNFTATSINVSNVNLTIFNATNSLNYTNSTSGLTAVSYNATWLPLLTDGVYYWSCQAMGSDFSNWTSGNRTLTIDSTAPTLSDTTNVSDVSVASVPYMLNWSYNASDIRLQACWYFSSENSTNRTITCNTTIQTNFTSNGAKTLYYFANDTLGNTANRTKLFTISQFTTTQATNKTSIVEGDTATFNFSLATGGSTTITAFSVGLYWNNTRYNISYFTANATYVSTNYTLTIPQATTHTYNSPWFFEYTINGTAWYNTTQQTQIIDRLLMYQLNLSTLPIYINFTIFDITTRQIINNTNIGLNFNYTKGNVTRVLNLSKSDNYTYQFTFYPAYAYDIAISGILSYSATGYNTNYYYPNLTLTNSTTSVALFLENSSETTLTTLVVKNQYQDLIEGVTIYVQRYNAVSDTYELYATGLTNFEGEDFVYLNWYDVFYKFILQKDSVTLMATNPAKIGDTPLTFLLIDNSTFIYDEFNSVAFNLTYNNNTRNFILTYVDTGNKISAGCLRVTKRNISGDTIVNESCSTSISATLYHTLGATEYGDYFATFYAKGSPWYVFGSIYAKLTDISGDILSQVNQSDATIYTIIIAGTIAFLGFFSPAAAVVLTLVGLVAAATMGFYVINVTTFVGLVVIAFIVIWNARRY